LLALRELANELPEHLFVFRIINERRIDLITCDKDDTDHNQHKDFYLDHFEFLLLDFVVKFLDLLQFGLLS